MCDRCGFGAGAHAISLSRRPAHRLIGYEWAGSQAQARAGAMAAPLAGACRLSKSNSGLWRSPVVALTWTNGPDGLRYFAGIAGEDAPHDGAGIDLPEMSFASSWHGPDDGSVIEHYLRMIEWIGDEGLLRDTSIFAQREEYPADHDPDGPLSLRLLLAVKTPQAR